MITEYIDKLMTENMSDEQLIKETESLFEMTDEDIENILNEGADELDEIEEDAFRDLDDILGEALIDQMRIEVINNKSLSEDKKVEALKKLETVSLEESDFNNFMNSLLKPALEVCGFVNGHASEEEPILVSVPVYESCVILEDAKNIKLSEIYKDDAKKLIDNIAENDGSSTEIIKKYNCDLAKSLLEKSLTEHGIEKEEDRNAVVNEAINLLSVFDLNDIKPNIIEAIKFIYKNNISQVVTESESDLSTLNEETISRITSFISEKYDAIKESDFSADLKQVVRDSDNRFLTGSTDVKISGLLGEAAFASIAISAYRNKKYNKCTSLEETNQLKTCMESACDDAISILKEQKSICENSPNKNKCNEKLNDLIIEWESRKERFKVIA